MKLAKALIELSLAKEVKGNQKASVVVSVIKGRLGALL